MSWRYVIEAEVARFNERVTDSPDLLAEPLRLRSAVSRQWAGYVDQEVYSTLPAKTGALFHGLVSNHAFVDGNKRTAVYAAIIFCRLNGGRVRATQDEIVDLAVETAAAPLTVKQVIERFAHFVVGPG